MAASSTDSNLQNSSVSFRIHHTVILNHYHNSYCAAYYISKSLNGVVRTLFEGVVDVEQGEVVSVDVGKPHLGLISRLLGLGGAHKALWD